MEVMDLEAEQRTRVRDQRAVAEVRGREAEARLARDHWLEDKLTQAEVERKESVRLMEMLRSARVISEARSGEDKTKERQQERQAAHMVFSQEDETQPARDSALAPSIQQSQTQDGCWRTPPVNYTRTVQHKESPSGSHT